MSQTEVQLVKGLNLDPAAPADATKVDSSGRFLIGTSSSRSVGGVQAALQLEGTNYPQATITLTNNQNTGNSGYLLFGKSRGTALGSNTIVNNGDPLGIVEFLGADGSNLRSAAKIEARVDGTPGASDMPGRLGFYTTADGAATPTERMRIDSSGRLGIGTTSPDFFSTNANNLVIRETGNGGLTIATPSAVGSIVFNDTDDTTEQGAIKYEHSTNSMQFATNSSERARIDSSGRLLVGGTTGQSVLGGPTVSVQSSGSAEFNILSGTSSYGGLYFGDGTSGTDKYRGYLEYNHATDNILLATASTQRFRVNENGAIGIAGANYGTSGQVLTTQGSGAAPQWASVSTGNDYNFASGNATGTTINITGIPSNALKIEVIFGGIGWTQTAGFYARVGSGSFQTSGYTWNQGYVGSSTSFSAYTAYLFLNNGFMTTAERIYGKLVLDKRTVNTWGGVYEAMSSNFSGGIIHGVGDAYAGGTLDRIQLAMTAGSFSTGYYTVNVYTE